MTALEAVARTPAEAPTVRSLLAAARRRLAGAPFRPPGREAALLLGHVLGLSEAQVLARSAEPVAPERVAELERLLARRLAGEPVAYLRGEREFYGRSFAVDSRVLIPRPETEHLVEHALALDLPPRPLVLDLGTGSGCIAVTLAAERPHLRAVGSDLAPGALAVARANAHRHGVGERVWLVAADLATGLDLARFDLVVSNPPYIAHRERALLSPEVERYEPELALFSPGEPVEFLLALLAALAPLPAGVPLVLELGDRQARPLRERLAVSPFEALAIHRDYGGRERIAVLRRRQPQAAPGPSSDRG